MLNSSVHTDVMIVGAGPTGLSLAVQLLRYNVDFVILDRKEQVTELSKALIVHARTLEIYDQVGLAQQAITQGEQVQKGNLMHDGKISAHLDFSDFGGQLSPFPFFLIYGHYSFTLVFILQSPYTASRDLLRGKVFSGRRCCPCPHTRRRPRNEHWHPGCLQSRLEASVCIAGQSPQLLASNL